MTGVSYQHPVPVPCPRCTGYGDAHYLTCPTLRPGAILRTAEAERDHAERLYAEHRRDCRDPVCPDCYSLDQHVIRTQRQVELLTPAESDMEAMF